MADLQTVYAEKRDIGLIGMLANAEHRNQITRTVETVAGIPWGVPCGRGASDDGCILGAVAFTFLGISVRDASRPARDQGKYAQYANARLMTAGMMWVQVGTAVTAGATAYWNIASGKWTVTGGDLAVPGAKFDMAQPTVNGLCRLALNIR